MSKSWLAAVGTAGHCEGDEDLALFVDGHRRLAGPVLAIEENRLAQSVGSRWIGQQDQLTRLRIGMMRRDDNPATEWRRRGVTEWTALGAKTAGEL